jgi:hypothetical protein
MLGRSLLIKASGARLLYPGYVQDYLDRVTAADVAAGNTQGLESGVTDVFNTCLQNMVSDTILGVSGNVLAQAASRIKASCAMQGARTLSGAKVPLASDMPAPTLLGTVEGTGGWNYNRRTGLQGNRIDNYIDSNRANNAEPQDNKHVAFYQNDVGIGSVYFAARAIGDPGNTYYDSSSGGRCSLNGAAFVSSIGNPGSSTLFGANRNSNLQMELRVNNLSTVYSSASSLTTANDITFGARISTSSGAPEAFQNFRVAFYSIGESLNLATLDARITALSSAIQAAIAP